MTEALFYRPREGWFGDVMPIVIDGICHLFYTHLDFDDHGSAEVSKQLKWAHLSTTDFVTFTEHATAIPAGAPGAQDLLAGAGSIVGPVDGLFHAFYVGINPHAVAPEREQVVLHATSTDLESWKKDPDFQFVADDRWYDPNAWRDPYVIPDGNDGWLMLLCAQLDVTPARRGGAVGMATSRDLLSWEAQHPLFAPGTTLAPECPEVFVEGSTEYLLFSTYSDRFAVRYRHRPAGTHSDWISPAWDALDSNDFYAATSVDVEGRRMLVGWLATRTGDTDRGRRQWGGDLVVHELKPRTDGSLGVIPLPSRLHAFTRAESILTIQSGGWDTAEGSVRAKDPNPLAPFKWFAVTDLDRPSLVTATIEVPEHSEEFGIAIHANDDFTEAYLVRFEPARSRFVFDRRPHRIDVPFDHDVDRSYVSDPDFEIERPLDSARSSHDVVVIVEGSCISIYIDDVALTTRGYDLAEGQLGFYVAGPSLTVSAIEVSKR